MEESQNGPTKNAFYHPFNFPGLAIADERTRDEHVYTLAVTNYHVYPDPAVSCEWAAPSLYAEPGEPIGGLTSSYLQMSLSAATPWSYPQRRRLCRGTA